MTRLRLDGDVPRAVARDAETAVRAWSPGYPAVAAWWVVVETPRRGWLDTLVASVLCDVDGTRAVVVVRRCDDNAEVARISAGGDEETARTLARVREDLMSLDAVGFQDRWVRAGR